MGTEEIAAMQTMNIALPDPMKEFVEDLVVRGDYNSASEYIGELVRADRKRREKARLEAMLLEGLSSGPMTEMTSDDWESIRSEVRQRIVEQQGRPDGPIQSDG